MPLSCPQCGAGVEATRLEGAARCTHCESVLYIEEGAGIPHRIVSSRRGENELKKAASDWLERSGGSAGGAAGGSVDLYYLPYFVCEGGEGDGTWNGFAAISVGVPEIASLAIYGTDTCWFDASVVPQGTPVLAPTLSAAEVCGGRKVVELRHVPVAQIVCESPARSGGTGSGPALWLDADRCRVLTGARTAPPRGATLPGLARWIALAGGAALVAALLLPLPWSLIPGGAVLSGFYLDGSRRFRSAPGGPGAARPERTRGPSSSESPS